MKDKIETIGQAIDRGSSVVPFQEAKGEFRIRDVELGKFLGMAKPANIRQTIAKYLREEKLNDSDVVTQRVMVSVGRPDKSGVPRSASQPVTEYLLTEGAALFVGARSDAPNGPKLMRLLAAVFEEWRKQNGAVSHLLTHYFVDAPAKLKDRLFPDLIRALLKLRAKEVNEPQVGNPAWGPKLASLVYEWSLKADGQQKHRRTINPSPNGSRPDYIWLSGEGLDSCRRVIQTGIDMARACDSYADWKYRMELSFGEKAIQLQLANPFSAKPKFLKPKGKK